MGNDCCSNRLKDSSRTSPRSKLEATKQPAVDEPPTSEEEALSALDQTALALVADFEDLRKKIQREVEREGESLKGVKRWRQGEMRAYKVMLENSYLEAQRLAQVSLEEAWANEDTLQQLLSDFAAFRQSYPDPDWLHLLRPLLSKSALYDGFQSLLNSLQSRLQQFSSDLSAVSAEPPKGQELAARSRDIAELNTAVSALLALLLSILRLGKERIEVFEKVREAEIEFRKQFEGRQSLEIVEEIEVQGRRKVESALPGIEEFMRLLELAKTQPGVLYSLLQSHPEPAQEEAETTDLLLAIELILVQHSKFPSDALIEYTVLFHFLDHFPPLDVMSKTLLFLKGLDSARTGEYLALVCDMLNLHEPPYVWTAQKTTEVVRTFADAKAHLVHPSHTGKWSLTGGFLPLKDLFLFVTLDSAHEFEAKSEFLAKCKPAHLSQLAFTRLTVLFAISHAHTESYTFSKTHFATSSHRLSPAVLQQSLRAQGPVFYVSDECLGELLKSMLEKNAQTIVRKNFTKVLDLSWFINESGKSDNAVTAVKLMQVAAEVYGRQ